MPFLKSIHKTPNQLIETILRALKTIENGESNAEKAQKDICENLFLMKNMMYGTNDTEPQTDTELTQLAKQIYNSNILLQLVYNLDRIEFEAKKLVTMIFNKLLRRQVATYSPTVEYVCLTPEILHILMRGYRSAHIALNCGSMLRECIAFEPLVKIILQSKDFYQLFGYIELSAFDIALDAFNTFKHLLMTHKSLCAQYLKDNFDTFFARYQTLLNSNNYMTRRLSIKLLVELLLSRHNLATMIRYVSSVDNLKLTLKLLNEQNWCIQIETFHVFKLFVANPNKPESIQRVLHRNKQKLVTFLTQFHSNIEHDQQFDDQLDRIIDVIKKLKQ